MDTETIKKPILSLVACLAHWLHISLLLVGIGTVLLITKVVSCDKALLIEPNSISFGEWDAGDKVITDQDSTIKKR